MKHRILGLSLVAICVSGAIQSQTLPNPGFENWEDVGTACENPQAWDSPNAGVALFGVCSVFKEESSVYAGSASAKLVTTLIPLVNLKAPSAISNGILIVNASDPFNSTVQGGSTIWGRPDALTGFYRYQPVGGDSLTIRVRLFDINGSDTTLIAEDEFFDDTNTGDYVPFTLPINYLTLDDAELAQVLIRSTRNTADATVGTTLWIDELRFTGITGINTLQDEMIGFTLYPNPTRDLLQVENLVEDRAYFQLMDRMGAVCHSSVLSTGQQWVDVSELNSGLYIYQFRNNAGTLLQSGKINLIR